MALRGDPAEIAIDSSPLTVPLLSSGILNAAGLHPGAISPGEIITLLGGIPETEPLLFINDVPAPILYAGAHQMNAIVPFGLDLSGPATLDLQSGSYSIAKIAMPVAPAAPALFTESGAGSGPGAILNQDYSFNSDGNPAARGSTVMLFGTGFGVLKDQPAGWSTDTGRDSLAGSAGGLDRRLPGTSDLCRCRAQLSRRVDADQRDRSAGSSAGHSSACDGENRSGHKPRRRHHSSSIVG